MLIYEPTCVCLEGYVRHNGNCIPKSCCPASPVPTAPAPCVTTTPRPCTTAPPPPCPTTPPPPCPTTKPPCSTTKPPCPTTKPPCPTTKPPCPTTKPPCPTTKPPCPTTKPSYVLTSPKPCGYTPPPRYKYPKVTLIPPPPPPPYQTLPPYRYPSVTSPRATAAPCYQTSPARPKPCATSPKPPPAYTTPRPPCSTKPPYRPTTPKPCPTTPAPPCPTTTKPCPPSTTPCPTTTTPCPTPPSNFVTFYQSQVYNELTLTSYSTESCAACEELVFTQPCCEPTCDFDCSDTASCPLVLIEEATCACRPGLVRFQGHCIEPSACPRSASRYRLYVPVAAQCLKAVTVALAIVSLVGYVAPGMYPFNTCSSNEVLVAAPPCCEPTCDCDCEQSSCQQLLVYQPTCVCMTGFVRLNGECVPKSCCPASEPYTPPPCETTTPYPETTACPPVYQPPSCGCDQYPCQCPQPQYQPPAYQPPVYQPPVYQPPVYQPYDTTMAPVYQQPSCGCGQSPCQCAALQYQPPAYQPCDTTMAPCETTTPPCAYPAAPVYEQPSCGCGQYPCQCPQPQYQPPAYQPPAYQPPAYQPPVYQPPVYQPCETTMAPCETTTPPCAYPPAPVYQQPSCGCGQYPCQCPQPQYQPPAYQPPVYQPPCDTTPAPCYTTPAPCYTTPAPCETPAPPTCNACEQLVFTQTCCEPTCDNDCSGVQCNPLLLVQEPTCACRPGLVRYQGHCVEPSSCPKTSKFRLYVPKTVSCAYMCSPYEVLKPSEPCCEPTCDDDCLHAICRRTPDAVPVPTCVCRQGYVRHEGSCIRKDSCPSPYANPITTYDSYLPRQYYTTPRPTMLRTCGLNEKLTHCRPACVPTCDNDCSGVKQPEVCVPETTCVCKEGYVRHNGRCIKRCDCPKRNPFQRRPVSGEYIDFEVVSLEGMKSDEDFNYRPQAEYRLSKHPFSAYGQGKKPSMVPMYLRTVTSAPNSGSASHEYTTTERPALYPPLCACHNSKKMPTPYHVPRMEEAKCSFESTEEDSDIVPYAPPPSVGPYSQTASMGLFPPSTPASVGPYFVPRKTLPAPPLAHRCDRNEPVDHFYASGQVASSGQQSSAAQDEPRKAPTIWPPVSSYCTRCGFKRGNRK
uniref:EGF-like domain-containing protein n=1 Tax=Anopheles dirus TaxID=7168 RepID=A0A182NIW6_9DIPT